MSQDFEKTLTVFEGSSPEDVSHARQLWSSLSLLPPLESRLESADVRQRLPVSRPQRSGSPAPGRPVPEPRSLPALRWRREEERRRYEAMAERRREILALLSRQRERRVRRELLSEAVKHKPRPGRETRGAPGEVEDTEEQLVEQLQ
ncbi:hypothetical protein L3Q82_002625 [Scortum barcoo]|uniref:Uncharacterized protein n=1 Tax=Scortum barcoo TaxID=214431 RepID=A0ACB8VUM5_9TELE|nr:hypothetical protein L3Q82_002625 [Scortum barcoo]